MTSTFRPLIFAAIAALTAVPAHACRVGGDRILFDAVPRPVGLAHAQIIRVQFTNVGPAYKDMRRRLPFFDDEGRALIGVAKVLGSGHLSKRYFPVYASVTSCTHGFFPNAYFKEVRTKWSGEFFVVGRFKKTTAGVTFNAGGDWNGRWHW